MQGPWRKKTGEPQRGKRFGRYPECLAAFGARRLAYGCRDRSHLRNQGTASSQAAQEIVLVGVVVVVIKSAVLEPAAWAVGPPEWS